MNLQLRKPTIADKHEIENFKAEIINRKENFPGGSWIMEYDSVEEWLDFLDILEDKAKVPDNLVPSKLYILVDQNQKIIGFIHLRLELNEWLENYGGHIGYIIHPNLRGMGFGQKLLALLLPKAKELGIGRLLITADPKNVASQTVIEKNNGRYEDTRVDGSNGGAYRRYWIEIDEDENKKN